MNPSPLAAAIAVAGSLAIASPALAQRFTFDRTLTTAAAAHLDVRTNRGKIDVSAGQQGRIVIKGTVTVRTGWDVPANAVELAKNYATNPEVEQSGDTVRLRPPSDQNIDRAVTVSYEIAVPPDTAVTTDSNSGATEISDVNGSVTVTTSSAAIDIDKLGGAAVVKTGSGAMTIEGVAGSLDASSQSGGLTLHGLRGALRATTGSGNLDVVFAAPANAEVETSSSAIIVRGLDGELDAKTNSGRVIVSGTPSRPWNISTGSSAIELSIPRAAPFSLQAKTGSGSLDLDGFAVAGTIDKRSAAGKVGAGGPLVTLDTRSGSIKLKAVAR